MKTPEEPDAALNLMAKELADLIPTLADRLGDLLDLSAGALASLIRARQLDYQHRPDPLPREYYEKLSTRVARMADGTLPPKGRWISGYYFNSAILRIGAAREKFRRLLAYVDKDKPKEYTKRLLSKSALDAIHSEYVTLKHDLSGQRDARRVTYQEAIEGLQELISVLKDRKDELSDPATGFPRMKPAPRVKRKRAIRPS